MVLAIVHHKCFIGAFSLLLIHCFCFFLSSLMGVREVGGCGCNCDCGHPIGLTCGVDYMVSVCLQVVDLVHAIPSTCDSTKISTSFTGYLCLVGIVVIGLCSVLFPLCKDLSSTSCQSYQICVYMQFFNLQVICRNLPLSLICAHQQSIKVTLWADHAHV